jgi:enoyl-CoA hydratase
MEYKNLEMETQGRTLIIRLNRPTKLNALNLETIEELATAVQHIYDNEHVSGVIVTGQGDKAFAAGADIGEIAELNELSARRFSERGQEVFAMFENAPKPIIAAVNGWALGGGCELAMACHMRVAVAKAKFGQPEVNLGVIPGYGGTQRLTQLIGKAKAYELILTGDTISASEAKSFGLVNHVVDNSDELIPKCLEILAKIYAKAPIAVGLCIDSINAAMSDGNGYQTEANHFAACTRTDDFKEGVAAFLEKRTPSFHNG